MNEDLKRFVQLQKEKQDIIAEMELLQKALSLSVSPYEGGDIVPICGWSHKGKKGIITECVLTLDDGGLDFIVMAKVLKKDGSESYFTATWISRHDPILQGRLIELNNLL